MIKYSSLFAFVCVVLTGCSTVKMEPTTKTPAPKKATSRPYTIKGITYSPQDYYEYDEVGIASFYGGGDVFHGRKTATGEVFSMNGVTAAHKTLPLPCMVKVTNIENGREIVVKVNDRGPFIDGRIIDVSRRVAQLLGFERKGTAKVRVQSLVDESLALNGKGLNHNPASGDVMLADAPTTTGPDDGDDILPVMAPLAAVSAISLAPLAAPTPAAPLPSVPALPSLGAAPEEVLVVEVDTPPLHEEAPQVANKANKQSVASTGIFVDVGHFVSLHEADRLAGLLSTITDTQALSPTVGSTEYVVRMGPLRSMGDADRLIDHLSSIGHTDARMIYTR